MKYKVFNPSHEKEINEFLNENRECIGRDSYWTEPKSGSLCFLFNEAFEPDFAQRVHMRSVWQKTLEKKCGEFADMVWKVDLWKQLPPDAKVGERDGSGYVGGKGGIIAVYAKDALKEAEITMADWEKQIEVLKKLLAQ